MSVLFWFAVAAVALVQMASAQSATGFPSSFPTSVPTSSKPTITPTTSNPTTATPSNTAQPTTATPTNAPVFPTVNPSKLPTGQPSTQPSAKPSTQKPSISLTPTANPSFLPTSQPSTQPSSRPTGAPTFSQFPTGEPSNQPTRQPTGQPSRQPTRQPSTQPSSNPTSPTGQPTRQPSRQPSSQPTQKPSTPTGQPSRQPSGQPTRQPSRQPSSQPSGKPSTPSGQPSSQPSLQPSSQPSTEPSKSSLPTGQPSNRPTAHPTISSHPSSHPSQLPSGQPSTRPTQQFATRKPTGVYTRSTVSGTVELDPANAPFCLAIELNINIQFDIELPRGDHFIIFTPGITSGVCKEAFNGLNIGFLDFVLFDGTRMTGEYFEGSRLTNYVTSFINVTLTDNLPANTLYHLRIDKLNGLKRTCVHNTTWEVELQHLNQTATRQGSLTFLDKNPRKCFVYNSSLVFSPPHPQLNMDINFTFLLPFTLFFGDSISIELPGFSNSIANYPLNGMISGNNIDIYGINTGTVGIGKDANISFALLPNNTNYSWSTAYNWKVVWNEGDYPNGKNSSLTLYPLGNNKINDIVWIYIDGQLNHLVSFIGSQKNSSGFKLSVITRDFNVNESSIFQSTAVGSACDSLSQCNGNGNCDYATSTCQCFDGFGSVSDRLSSASPHNYQPDCSGRSCPKGPAYVAVPRKALNGYHQLAECSNKGNCNRVSGKCHCFDGHNGGSCEKLTCPNSIDSDNKGAICGGRGQCLPIGLLPYENEATPLRQANISVAEYINGDYNKVTNISTWDADVGHACVCDSSWSVGLGAGQRQMAEFFGSACQLRHCPSGDDPSTSPDETDCFGVAPLGGMTGLLGNLCQIDCSNRGICDYKNGVCACFDGYTGVACNEFARGTYDIKI